MVDHYTKPWGTAKPVYRDNNVETVLIDVLPGGFSSEHMHKDKSNQFIVLSGFLWVMSWDDEGNEIGSTPLGVGDSTFIPAGTWHKFDTVAGCVALEIYRTPAGIVLRPDDIIRRKENGRRET